METVGVLELEILCTEISMIFHWNQCALSRESGIDYRRSRVLNSSHNLLILCAKERFSHVFYTSAVSVIVIITRARNFLHISLMKQLTYISQVSFYN